MKQLSNRLKKTAAGAATLCAALSYSVAALAQEAAAKDAAASGLSATKGAADSMIEYAKIAVPYLLTAAGALVVFVIGRIVANWVGRTVKRSLEKRDFDRALTKFLSGLARTLVLVSVVIGILGMFGIETTSFAAIIGAAGLAIGLAFQGSLSNFAAGVLLLTFRPFDLGDLIKGGGEIGIVEEIGLFTVTLLTLDNQKVIIPNTGVTSANITNMTAMETRRVDVNLGTDYGADLDETRAVLDKVVAKVKGGLKDPEPQVFLAELGDSAIGWQLRVWCKTEDYWDVWQLLTRDAKVALDEAGIGIPFPQMDVHLDKTG